MNAIREATQGPNLTSSAGGHAPSHDAPEGVGSLLWQLSSPSQRQDLLQALAAMQGRAAPALTCSHAEQGKDADAASAPPGAGEVSGALAGAAAVAISEEAALAAVAAMAEGLAMIAPPLLAAAVVGGLAWAAYQALHPDGPEAGSSAPPGYGEDPTPLPDTTLPPNPGKPLPPPGPEVYPLPEFQPPITLPGGSTEPVLTPPVVTPVHEGHWVDSIYEARPSVDERTWHYPIRDDLDKHLVHVDSPRGGGGHNEQSFIAWVTAQGGTCEIKPTERPGIHEIHARIPKSGDPSKEKEIFKTTYDPAVYPDGEMNRMAREAGKKAWDRYQAGDLGDDPESPGREFEVTVEGVKFRAYINPDTAGRPCVGNIHPIR